MKPPKRDEGVIYKCKLPDSCICNHYLAVCHVKHLREVTKMPHRGLRGTFYKCKQRARLIYKCE